MSLRVYATPAGVKLGSKDLIAPDSARNFMLEIGEAHFHGFIVRKADAYYGYVDRCPHAGLPLAQELDDYLTPQADLISCSWHGALFRIASGQCIGGPCAGQSLTPWPVQIEGDHIVTA
jgi:nitrite reductase/ring-hydroxylating ferredoxin subunit